jgi:two-component system OmpR family response regulator
MSSCLIVVCGPPLPGRWSLARAVERRCGARRFVLDTGTVPGGEIRRALAEIGCVLVDGDLPTVEGRREVLALHQGRSVLVEWRCRGEEAEREIFRRYASRPQVLSRAEYERYRKDAARRVPVGEEVGKGRVVVRVGPEMPLDDQADEVVRAVGDAAFFGACGGEPRGRRVMVVEDDPDERATLAEVLEELGFQVELAPDAGVALALLDEGADVELLISDHRMPGMCGVELSRELRRRHPHVRTVLLTAYGDDETCRSALQAHAVTVLSKPLRVIDLERVLDEAAG